MADVIDLKDYLNKKAEDSEPELNPNERVNLTEHIIRELGMPYVPCALDESALTAGEHQSLWQLRLLQHWFMQGKFPRSAKAQEIVKQFETNMVFMYNYIETVVRDLDALELDDD